MTLYEQWLVQAYTKEGTSVPAFWDKYMPVEQKIYEAILTMKTPAIKGTVADLAEKANMEVSHYVGFLDGISEALEKTIELNKLEAETKLNVKVNLETLYKKMVEYKADHLLALKEWEGVFTEEQRTAFYREQKASRTVVRETKKVGRNEPCPCGSGKKYKQCCGA